MYINDKFLPGGLCMTLGKSPIFSYLTLNKKIGSQILSQNVEVKSIDFTFMLKLFYESFL